MADNDRTGTDYHDFFDIIASGHRYLLNYLEFNKAPYHKERLNNLIVDDEKVICKSLSRLFADDYTMYKAHNGIEPLNISQLEAMIQNAVNARVA